MSRKIYRNAYRYAFGVWAVAVVPFAVVSWSLPRVVGDLPTWIRIPAFGVVIALGIAWLVEPIWAARFRILTVDADGVTLRAGWFAPETRQAARTDITSVQVEQPLAGRLTNRWSVAIFTHGVTEAAMTMPAVTQSDAKELVELAQGPAQSRQDHSEDPIETRAASENKPGDVLYRASASDILITATSSGVPLVIAAGVLGFAFDFAELTTAISWASPVVLGIAVACGVITVCAITALKFWDYSILKRAGGEITVRYGAIETVEHTLAPQERLTVTARRSLVDLLFNKASLRYSHAQAEESSGKRVIFPSMSPTHLARTAHALDARGVGLSLPEPRFRWAVAQLSVIATGATLTGTAVRADKYLLAGLALVATILGTRLLNFASRRMSQSDHPELLKMCTAGLSHATTLIPHESLSMVVSRRLPALRIRIVSMTGWSHGRLRFSFATRADLMLETVIDRAGLADQPQRTDPERSRGEKAYSDELHSDTEAI